METPDPPSDTPGALKQVVLTPHDIPWSLRVVKFLINGGLCELHDAGEPFVGEKTLRHRISERCAHCGRSMSLFTARVFLY